MTNSKKKSSTQMDRFDAKVKDFYQSMSMSEDRLDKILLREEAEIETSKNVGQNKFKIFSVAATIMIAVLLVQMFAWQRDVANVVFEEIAMNHNKRLESEFVFNDYQVLSKAMHRLDFLLTAPKAIVDNYDLLGGRYCSINGNLAAQLKVKNKQNQQIATLYVTHLDDDLRSITTSKATVDNADIELWKTGGKLFGLALDATSD